MAGASSSAPAASISDDEGSSAGLTGIEREAAERSRQHGTTAETSSGGPAANAGQAPAQAGQQDAGVGGDESDRLTLLAQPPVAGEDVVISSSSVTGFAPGQTGEIATDDTAESLNDESLKESAGGTVAATAEPRSFADAEVGLSDEGPESAASSPTPTGEDAEFVAGTDIEWSSPAEWEELEEEAEVSAPVQATGAMNQASTSTSTATSSSSSQEIADSRGDAGTGTAGAGGGATATASDQATIPYGAIPGDGSRECPSDHPIKGNANSMIYHMPGQSSYDGTEPEYCFANEEDAVAAGYRASKARGRSDTGDEHAHQPQDARHDQDDETAGVAAATTTEPATTAEREMSLRSDADISTTPPAAITSRPGTNQPMGQAASGAMAAASMQTAPSSPASGTAASAHRGSVPGDGSRACPDDYPIKGNRNSMIYHMPHQSSYQGTKAEICFATEEEAISAGYRRRREPGESASDAHGHHGDNHGNASTAAHAGGSRDSQPGKEQTSSASASGSDGHKAEAMTSSDATPQSGAPTGSVVGDGTHDCPAGYPIKGNASSRIYHMPGQSAYEVTEPEFCFATEDAATAAGYRAAKR
jgi:methylphosphotriester-DNA--protein-cysteine methyltransferase